MILLWSLSSLPRVIHTSIIWFKGADVSIIYRLSIDYLTLSTNARRLNRLLLSRIHGDKMTNITVFGQGLAPRAWCQTIFEAWSITATTRGWGVAWLWWRRRWRHNLAVNREGVATWRILSELNLDALLVRSVNQWICIWRRKLATFTRRWNLRCSSCCCKDE